MSVPRRHREGEERPGPARSVHGAALLSGIGLFALALPADGQVIRGRVLDSVTNEPVATALVSLETVGEKHVVSALSDAGGRFSLRPAQRGAHRLEIQRLGYRARRTEVFEVEAGGLTLQNLVLVPEAFEMEEITARVRPGHLLHAATLSGVYARRARSPSVGSNRVLVRGQDPDLDAALRVEDLLPPWLPRPGCRRGPTVYADGWEGRVYGPGSVDFLLKLSTVRLEAIEFYRDPTRIPMELGSAGDARRIRRCGFVAIWTRGARR